MAHNFFTNSNLSGKSAILQNQDNWLSQNELNYLETLLGKKIN